MPVQIKACAGNQSIRRRKTYYNRYLHGLEYHAQPQAQLWFPDKGHAGNNPEHKDENEDDVNYHCCLSELFCQDGSSDKAQSEQAAANLNNQQNYFQGLIHIEKSLIIVDFIGFYSRKTISAAGFGDINLLRYFNRYFSTVQIKIYNSRILIPVGRDLKRRIFIRTYDLFSSIYIDFIECIVLD